MKAGNRHRRESSHYIRRRQGKGSGSLESGILFGCQDVGRRPSVTGSFRVAIGYWLSKNVTIASLCETSHRRRGLVPKHGEEDEPGLVVRDGRRVTENGGRRSTERVVVSSSSGLGKSGVWDRRASHPRGMRTRIRAHPPISW